MIGISVAWWETVGDNPRIYQTWMRPSCELSFAWCSAWWSGMFLAALTIEVPSGRCAFLVDLGSWIFKREGDLCDLRTFLHSGWSSCIFDLPSKIFGSHRQDISQCLLLGLVVKIPKTQTWGLRLTRWILDPRDPTTSILPAKNPKIWRGARPLLATLHLGCIEAHPFSL